MERAVKIKFKAVDDTTKVIDTIDQKLKQIEREAGKAKPKSSWDVSSYKAALSDIQRLQKENLRWEKTISREIEQNDKQTASNKIREAKRGTNAVIAEIKQIGQASKQSASTSSSFFSSIFGASFFGTLGANAVSALTSKFAQIPSIIRGILDEAVAISQERANALKGLESITVFKGIDSSAATAAVQNLKLVKAGIVDIGSASNALKSLLQTNFTLDESIQLIERFSDTSAFGKQSSLSYSRAIESIGEALKNNNPLLLDNAGMSKNLSVILKELGKSEQDAGNLASDASVRMAAFSGIMKETQGSVGDADKLIQGYTGSVAALDMAQQNLYAAIGNVITQNPELIALIRVLTGEVNSTAESFEYSGEAIKGFNYQLEGIPEPADNAGDSLNRTTSSLSSLILKTEIFGARFDATMKSAQLVAGQLANVARIVGRSVAVGMYQIVESVLILPINTAIEKINSLSSYFPGIAGGGQLPTIPVSRSGLYGEIYGEETAEIYKKRLEIKDIWKQTESRVQSLRDDFNQFRNQPTPSSALVSRANTSSANSGDSASGGGSGGGGGGRGRRRTAISKGERDYNDLKKFAEGLGFDVTSTTGGKHNAGSLHGQGKAIDVRTRNKTAQEIADFIAEALKKGMRVVDERIRPPGSKVWGGEHLHIEENFAKESFLNPSLSYGNTPINLLRKLDNDRFEKRPGVNNRELSDFLTKQADETRVRGLIENFSKLGIVPGGGSLSEIQKLLAQDAEQAGTVQPTLDDVLEKFKQIQSEKTILNAGVIETQTTISTEIEKQLDQDEIALQNQRESLNLGERFIALTQAITNHEGIVNNLIEDRVLAQEEELDNLNKQYDVQQALFGFDFYKKYEQDILVLREKMALQQDIFDLENRIATQGMNNAERYKRAWLEAIYEVKDANTQAVESQIRSQVQLANATVVSNDQIRAKVLGHLASQKTVNDAYADGIISIYDKIGGKIDSVFDNINEKAGGFLAIFTEPAKAITKNFLSNITTNLLDTFLPEFGGLQTQTDNPIARPVVEIISKSNDLLTEIRNAVSVNQIVPGVASGGGFGGSGGGGFFGGIGGLLKGVLGGGGNGTPAFSPNTSNGDGYSSVGSLANFANQSFGQNIGGGQQQGGGSFLGNLRGLFGKGGVFGSQGFGNNVGTYGAVGSLASLFGGMVGGRAGGFISGAGGGLALGAQIGTMFGPWGTAIGAGIGALVGGIASLFSNPGNKEKDAASQGRILLHKELNKILEGVSKRPPSIQSDTAISNAETLLAEYYKLLDTLKVRKVREGSIRDTRRLSDPIVQNIREEAAKAKAWEINRGNTSANFTGQFAGGTFMSDDFLSQYQNFRRRNGLLPGLFDGMDNLPSMLSKGEMVLNPRQIAQIKVSAGYDVFAPANIPNYTPKREVPKFSTGVNLSSTSSSLNQKQSMNFSPNITINMKGEGISKVEIEDIAINGVSTFFNRNGRRSNA